MTLTGLGVEAFALVYGVGPLVVQRTLTMTIDPDAPAVDPAALDPADRNFFVQARAALEEEGFLEAGLFHVQLLRNIGNDVSLLIHAHEQTGALIATIRPVAANGSPTGKVKRYVEFSTVFNDGREINTSNAMDIPAVGQSPKKLYTGLSDVPNPIQLWQIHQAIVADAIGHATRRPIPLGSAAAYFCDSLRRDLDEKVGRGMWRKIEEGRYCPTLRGAYLMTWGELPPIKQIRVHRSRSRASDLRQRLGV